MRFHSTVDFLRLYMDEKVSKKIFFFIPEISKKTVWLKKIQEILFCTFVAWPIWGGPVKV
jgi:hypothetical protein